MKCPVCKKNISDSALKCPYCKSRAGLMCSSCSTVNPVGSFNCKECGNELLKLCPNCNSVNFPGALKCRKCGSPFGKTVTKKQIQKLIYEPDLVSRDEALNLLTNGIKSGDKKIFSICGPKGTGKTTLLHDLTEKTKNLNIQWCIGKCTQLTQLTPGGVIQNMLLNLFKLPDFCVNSDEFIKNATDFFAKEFKFLNHDEVNNFLNFIYNFKDGNYEDIIINKKNTHNMLKKIFEAFTANGNFIYVADNFDFIDGFSAEFFNNLFQNNKIRKNFKLIVINNSYKPVESFFGFDEKYKKSFLNINLAPANLYDKDNNIRFDNEKFLSEHEKEIIYSKSNGNISFALQAVNYAFDCQTSDKTFILPDNFDELIKIRLNTLKKNNIECYKILCASSVLGDKLNTELLKEIFGYSNVQLHELLTYLEKSSYIRKIDDNYYEFSNLSLWEAVLKNITKDSVYEDINVKVGKALSVFTLNTNPVMAMIAHNLKENRMAFDIWTKTARLSAYIGDINLYVIAQKQCLALLNEFNENETVNIRYSISEKLGKLLTEYDAEEAIDYLPDAISNAERVNDEVKEIELLGYLANCCQKTGKYFGNVECTDKIIRKLPEGKSLEKAMILTSKLSALVDIGNCGEVISIIDTDILPVLNTNLSKPRFNKLLPPGVLFDTWLKVYLILATALALQGSNRASAVLKNLSDIIKKHNVTDRLLICKYKLVLAYTYTMKGDYKTSDNILEEINGNDSMDDKTISRWNLISIINKFLKKDYGNLREELFESVAFANNSGDNFTKNILKVLLGKIFKEENKAQRALGIYNEQVTYFAKEKMALGALLSWYLISDATIVTENSKSAIDVAQRALEIAQNPKIDNKFFIVILKKVLAVANINISDYESAKIHLESAIIIAKKYCMYDLLSQLYLLYGKYYQDIGAFKSQKQLDYLKGAALMYEKAMELVVKETNNSYVKNAVNYQKNKLHEYCTSNGFKL